ncbi:ARID DNA-binding domain-containing protein [Tanacetum coccineum]
MMKDMFHFALVNRPPSYVILISGDADFCPTFTALHDLGYTTVLIFQPGRESQLLRNLSDHTFFWDDMCKVHLVSPIGNDAISRLTKRIDQITETMVNTNAFLEANWHRKNKHICQSPQWYRSKILGKPLRRMSQSEFAQRHIKREKEERIGVSNAQEYGHFANKCTSKKQWEPKVSLKYPEFIHFKTRGIIKGTDKGTWDDFWGAYAPDKSLQFTLHKPVETTSVL